MPEERQFPLGLRIVLPLLLAVVIGITILPSQQAEIQRRLQLARQQNDLAAESTYLAQLAEWQPWQPALWEEAGSKALQAGEVAAAIRYLRRAQERNTLPPAGFEQLAEAYLLDQQPEKAYSIWKTLIDQDSASTRILEKVSLQNLQGGKFYEAQLTAEKWVQRDASNPRAHFNHGLIQLVLDPAQATKPLIQAKTLDLALAARVDALVKALQTSQKESHAGFQKVTLGRALANLGYWKLAEEVFLQGTKLTPNYAESWAFLGEARQQLGQNGLTELKTALEYDPKSIVAQALLALYYRRNGKAEESLVLLRSVAQAEPKQPMWQVELGNTLVVLRDISTALRHYQVAASIDPKDARYWILLAQFSAEHQASVREVGLPAARQALTLAPEDSAALDVMGLVMMNLDDLVSAGRFFEQALQKDRGYSAAYLHLGQLNLQMGQMQDAQVYLQQAKQFAGENSDVRLLAQRLLERYFGNP